MRRFIIALAFLGAVVITLLGSGSTTAVKSHTPVVAKAPAGIDPQARQDPTGTIDGAATPNLIPDEVAYSLFFNFLAGRTTEKEKNTLKSYMQQAQLADVNLEALLSTAQEYQRDLNAIDEQRSALLNDNHQGVTGIENRLNELNQRKLDLVNEKLASLPNRLGKAGAENVRRHVMEYIKRKVKIIPGPVAPMSFHGN